MPKCRVSRTPGTRCGYACKTRSRDSPEAISPTTVPTVIRRPRMRGLLAMTAVNLFFSEPRRSSSDWSVRANHEPRQFVLPLLGFQRSFKSN